MTECKVYHLISGIYHTSCITTTTYSLVGKSKALELLKVRLKELQRLGKEIQSLTSHRQSLWEGEGILYWQSHIRYTKLSLYSTITILHGRMYDALWMNEHLYPICINAEEPLSLDNLKALIHHRGRIDSYLCTHIPCRMLEGIGSSYGLHLLKGELTERTTRSREKDFLYLSLMVAHEALEYGRMFRINRKDRRMILLCKSHDEFTSHNESFLVGKANLLASLDGMDCWSESCKAHHSRENHIDRFSLNHITESLSTCIYLDIRTIGKQFLQLLILILIGNNNGSRAELTSLLGKQFYLIVGGETVSLETLTMLLYDFKSLSTDRACTAQNTYLLFFHFLILMSKVKRLKGIRLERIRNKV